MSGLSALAAVGLAATLAQAPPAAHGPDPAPVPTFQRISTLGIDDPIEALFNFDVQLFNDANLNIHILGPGETIADSNRLEAGQGRLIRLDGSRGDVFDFEARRNFPDPNSQLANVSCIVQGGQGSERNVVWRDDGFLHCEGDGWE